MNIGVGAKWRPSLANTFLFATGQFIGTAVGVFLTYEVSRTTLVLVDAMRNIFF